MHININSKIANFCIEYFEEEDLLDIRDFENIRNVTNTYAGHKREVIDILKEDLDNNDYKEIIKIEEYDPKELLNPNFKAYK